MIQSLHNHTTRCHHATGTEEEYVLAAIAGGLESFGFSDHAPQHYPGDYVSRVRMLPQQLPPVSAFCPGCIPTSAPHQYLQGLS